MTLICGVDEAGRGPLAGPVVAAAVILGKDFPVHLLKDSKKLTPGKRTILETLIKEQADGWAVAVVSHRRIDEINILQRRWKRCTTRISTTKPPDHQALIDGDRAPILTCAANGGQGDDSIPEIMAASILARWNGTGSWSPTMNSGRCTASPSTKNIRPKRTRPETIRALADPSADFQLAGVLLDEIKGLHLSRTPSPLVDD